MHAFSPRALLVLLAAATATVGVVSAATPASAASASPRWHVTVISPPQAVPNVVLESVACPSASRCEAVGFYSSAESAHPSALPPYGGTSYFSVTESRGSWAKAIAGLLPSDSVGPEAVVSSIACPAAGSCVAVGSYMTTSIASAPFIAVERDGKWVDAFGVSVPAGAVPQGSGVLSRVSCTTVGTCLAIGFSYTDSTGAKTREFSIAESGGHWHRATTISFGGSAAVASTLGLGSLACTRAECVAVGFVGTTHFSEIALTESHGRWHRTPSLRLPVKHAASQLLSVSCEPSGACVAAGWYGSVDTQMMATLSDGHWSKVIPLTRMPPGAPSAVAGSIRLAAVTCIRSFCLAAGTFQHKVGFNEWLAIKIVDGGWRSATAIPLTGVSYQGAPNQVYGASCAESGSCAIVGVYTPEDALNGAIAATLR